MSQTAHDRGGDLPSVKQPLEIALYTTFIGWDAHKQHAAAMRMSDFYSRRTAQEGGIASEPEDTGDDWQ
jgi:hypothetical protein